MATFGYLIPSEAYRDELIVVNSRFIVSVGFSPSVDEARSFLSSIRNDMPDASHHVYAYRIGYGGSIIESMSDDGEPSGTAGPPVLAVLRGTDIGDTIVVVTRYFGGTLLGTGGLVRAYTEAAQRGLTNVKKVRKIARKTVGIETPYNYYQLLRRLYDVYQAVEIEESFAGEVTITARFPSENVEPFSKQVVELTAGNVTPVELD